MSRHLEMEFKRLVESRRLNELKRVEGDAGQSLSDVVFPHLALFLGIGFLEEIAEFRALRSGMGGIDRTGEGAVSREREGTLLFGAVGVGVKHGQCDDLTSGAGNEGSVAALQVGWQISNRRALVGGVEDRSEERRVGKERRCR